MTGARWRIGQTRAYYSGATWAHAWRPHPEAPDQAQEIAAPDRTVLYAALAVHDHLDRLREKYGHAWVVGADEIAWGGVIRWVWAQPREHGRPALRPVATPEELEAALAAHSALEEVAP